MSPQTPFFKYDSDVYSSNRHNTYYNFVRLKKNMPETMPVGATNICYTENLFLFIPVCFFVEQWTYKRHN